LEGTHSRSKTFHVVEHVRAYAPLEIIGAPRLRTTALT